MSEIRFNDRVLVIGQTQSGKSEVLNFLTTQLIRARGAQVVVVDTKHEFAIPDVPTTHGDVAAIDERQPVIHYRHGRGGTAEMEALFAWTHSRRRITVVIHELSDVCEFNAGKTPPSYNEQASKGAALGQGQWCGSQRPCEIPSRARSESEHVIVMARGFALPQDIQAVAQAIEMSPRELPGKLSEVQNALGEHAYIHFDRRAKTIEACPPLTDTERASIIIQRPQLY